MLINKLRDYYGFPGSEEQRYLDRVTSGMSETRQNELAEIIIQNCQKKYGFPDVYRLSKFIQEAERSAPQSRTCYWSVCNDCKAEFDYRFQKCPVCFSKGAESSGYKVKVSTEGIPGKVIRWNQFKMTDEGDGTFCVSCENRDRGYCRWFGDPNHFCDKSDFEYCDCKKCCITHKRANEKLLKK